MFDAQNDAYRRGYTRARLQFQACEVKPVGPNAGRIADGFVAANARNLQRHVYVVVTLFAGDVLFDEIGMLQAHEFDGEAIFDVADDATLCFADGDHDTDRRP